jgi:lipoprotein-anchoring transpeptidase ErfK/SrfK
MAWPSGRISAGRVLGAFLTVLALTTTAACGGSDAQWRSAGGGSSPQSKPPAMLAFTQENNAVDVSPVALVAVTVSGGRLDTVSLVDGAGAELKGALDADNTVWKNTDVLGYGTSYTLAVSSTGEDGKRVQETRTFTTLTPNNFTMPYIRAFGGYGPLLDGGTFGVGQPIVIEFDEVIGDRAAAERSLSVTTDPPTLGAWRWIRDDEVHWRPKEYWVPGTKVTVAASVFGVHLGDGLYGQENRSASFMIGPSKIAVADHDTKRMQIYINGVDVTASLGDSWNPDNPGPNYDHSEGAKISMGAQGAYDGKGHWFDMRTSSGAHVVMEKEPLVRMRPALPKDDPLYYEENVPYAVRITSSGLYVHWADWSVYDQGIRNVSHGCVNMSPNDALWFYNNFSYGDIVDIRNTGKPLDLTDGLGDWILSWEEWVQGSALS